MPIISFDNFIASAKQYVSIVKTAARTTIATSWFSTIELAGNPGAGVLAGANLANGVVPTDLTAGFPAIDAFAGGAIGYIAQVDFGSTVPGRIKLVDLLWKAGAYAFNAAQALTAQPSYSARLPGAVFTDTQIWIEAVTAFTGNLTVTITYVNQAGVAARTATLATGNAMTIGRWMQVPLQTGDSGVQRIDNVTGTVATVGTFNVLVVRPLWSGRVKIANDGDVHDMAKTGMPQLFADTALALIVSADGTSTGIPELELVIANG